jgi:hypothetical protein
MTVVLQCIGNIVFTGLGLGALYLILVVGSMRGKEPDEY